MMCAESRPTNVRLDSVNGSYTQILDRETDLAKFLDRLLSSKNTTTNAVTITVDFDETSYALFDNCGGDSWGKAAVGRFLQQRLL